MLSCCGGGVGSDFCRFAGVLDGFENVSLPGENGGVGAVVFAKFAARADSGRGVEFEVPKDEAWPDKRRVSVLLRASSKLIMFFALLGDALLACLRLDRLSPLCGKTRSVGLTMLISSGHMLVLLEAIVFGSSTSLPFPFRLSLRRSRMPFELRFLTAGLRNNAPLEESRLWCDSWGVAETAVNGSAAAERPLCKILPVSMCSGVGPLGVWEYPARGAGLSSLQSAGVGGTVSNVVP